MYILYTYISAYLGNVQSKLFMSLLPHFNPNFIILINWRALLHATAVFLTLCAYIWVYIFTYVHKQICSYHHLNLIALHIILINFTRHRYACMYHS